MGSEFIRWPYPYRTVLLPTVFQQGPFSSTA
jgi:hypothetical protein